MERDRLDDLWSRFLAGQPLAPEEEAELESLLTNDPSLRAELLADLKIDQSLRGAGRVDRDADAFTDSFRYRLKTERDGTRFIDQVRVKVRKARKPSTRRWGAGEGNGLRIALAAAAVLLAIGLLAVAFAPGRKPEPSAKSVPRPMETAPVEIPARSEPPTPAPERRPTPESPPPIPNLPNEPPKNVESRPSDPKPETPAPVRPAETRVAEAAPPPAAVFGTLGRVQGDVRVVAGTVRAPAQAGQKLLAGQGLETPGSKSGALLQCSDGTRIELGTDSSVSEFAEAGRGKRVALDRGTLSADVVRQPADQPMIVTTPHGEARVLGTSFKVVVEAGSMRLDVKEGKVRLTRASDRRSVDVPAGYFASAGPAIEPELNSEHRVTLAFQDGVHPTPKYAGTSDTLLNEGPKQQDRNFGAAPALWVDGSITDTGDDRYILIRWDLSAIPPRSTVLSATIDVQVSNDSKGTAFELFEMKRDWTEGGATWKAFGPKLLWQTPGAQGAQDRGAAIAGILSPRAAGPYTLKLTADGAALVQAWIDNPTINHGFIIANTANQDAVGIASREASVSAHRPRLTVHFVPRGPSRPK